VPVPKRRVITTHDAFGYFARAYGVEFLSLRGVNPERDPDAQQMAAIVTLARQEKVRALFVENIGNPMLMRQVAEEAGGVVGDELFPDTLSSREGPAASYDAMMRHNVSALVAGMLEN
jgi:zinc/manganese transport system substrate-binding protein